MNISDSLLQRLKQVDEEAKFIQSPNRSYLVFNSRLFTIDLLLTSTALKVYYIQTKVPGMGSKLVNCVVAEAQERDLDLQAIFVLPKLEGFWRRNGFDRIEPGGNNYRHKAKKKPGP